MPDTVSESTSVLLMSPGRVHRSLNRMAYQITEDNRDDANILLLGLKKRGFTVAQLLAERLQTLSNKKVEVQQFIPGEDSLDHCNEDFSYVILVDDVIFSGRTMLNALQHLVHGGSGTIRTAVLVDRGHRSVPVEASFAGLELPTKLNEHVHVETAEALVIKVVLNYSSH